MTMENKIYYYLDQIKKLQNGEFVPPVSCEIDPSNQCPADCSFCMFSQYIKTSRVHMKWDVYLKLIYELKHLGTKSITFTGGGEPLMNPKFNDMAQVAHDLGFEIGLVTNGILMNELQNAELFKFIRVSLDAGTHETYQKVKGIDAFSKVVENMTAALKINKTVGISYVVGPDNNTMDELNMAQGLADNLGAAYIQFKPMYINGGIFTDYKLPTSTETTIKTPRYKTGEKLPCIIAHLVGVVTADNSVYYCCQGRGKLNYRLGSISQESFESLWRQRLKHTNIALRQCPPCRYSNYAKTVKELLKEGDYFFEHKYFL